MSTYYYLYSHKTHEFFELTSGSWWPYMEDMNDVLQACISKKKSYKEFINILKKQKVFDGFYDDYSEFITTDNEKYFLQPLYNWAYEQKDNLVLIDDGTMYDEAVKLMCTDKGIKYERKYGWDYSQEIENEIKKFKSSDDALWDHYLKCVGKLNYDDKIMNQIGVSFEHAIAELKAGAKIWRKEETGKGYIYLKDNVLFGVTRLCGDSELGKNGELYTHCFKPRLPFTIQDVTSDYWQYSYDDVKIL